MSLRFQDHKSIKQLFSHTETYVLIVILVMAFALEIATHGKFLSFKNLSDIFMSNLYLAIVAMGMLVVIVAAGLDLSCLAIATIAQYAMCRYLLTDHSNMFIAILIVVGVGFALGLVNGLLVYRYKVPSMIITIATMNTYSALLQWTTKSTNLYGFPEWFSRKGVFGSWPVIIIFALAVFLTAFILKKTKMGRNIYAIGGNLEGARRVGINIFATQVFVYSYIGVLAGLAGLTQQYLLRNYSPNTLVGNELDIVVMVVIGGASLVGGRGTVVGTLLGVVLLAFVSNGMTLLGVSSYSQSFVTGMVILTGLIFVTYFDNRKYRHKKIV